MMAALPLAVAADIRVVEEIAAKVNGEIVTRGELEEQQKELEAFLRQQRHLKGVELTEAEQEESKHFLRDKIDQLLFVQKAKDLNISVDGDVAKRLAEMQVVAKITDPDKFHDYIRDNAGIPFEEYKQKMTNDYLVHRIVSQEIGARIAIPEPDLRKYYDAHKADFVRKAQVFWSQILISTEGKTPEQTAAAETKARDVAARARRGEKWSDLVAAYSDDPDAVRTGGAMPPREKGMSLPAVEDFLFKEKKGGVSDPIKISAPQGLVILRIDERYEAGQASFDEVKEQIQETLSAPQLDARIRTYLTKLRQEAFLEIKDGYVDTGAASGKDTHWHDIAQLKPQTTTKEEVAASHKRHKHVLFVPIPGTTATKGTTPNIDTSKLGEPAAPAKPAAPAPAATDTPATTPIKQ
jgi:parvulin-like peptidyl-prolyl isomerase